MIEKNNKNNCTVDIYRNQAWEQLLSNFSDANIYQTYAYAKICYGENNISTLVVRKDNKPITAALVNIRKVPGIPLGIAYVFYGPLWKSAGNDDYENYVQGINALVQEYVKRRGLALRIRPFLYDDETALQYDAVLREAGLSPLIDLSPKKTLLIDLSKSLDALRKGLDGKWRSHLNRAEKNNLTIVDGTNDELFDQFQPVHEGLLEKKQIEDIKGVEIFKNIQQQLPPELKMRVFLGEHSGVVCAGIIVSAIGNVGITLSRATSDIGRQQQAAYLVQWKALQWLKDAGCSLYDLSGIDESANPGTYSYKTGLCGKNGRELQMMRQYQMSGGKLKEIMLSLAERGLRAARG
jgi:lipid II:glycine glycyltransferase (peptidoglycan interpeptide bridge formation enzyme)